MDERSPLAKRIERELEEAGLAVVVEDTPEELVVTGIVDSEEERQAVLDIVRKGTGDNSEVSDNVEVAGALPEETSIGNLSETEIAGFDGAEAGLQDFESLMPGDFIDQRMSGAAGVVQAAASSDSPSDGGDESGEDGDIVYVPPIDPVGTDRVVIGGFQTSSMDSAEVERSSDGTFRDEAIREAVLRELLEDAATTALTIQVTVRGGVVRLSGRVDDLEDADSAQEVAARVPGVVDVLEDLDVAHLSSAHATPSPGILRHRRTSARGAKEFAGRDDRPAPRTVR